MSASTLSSPLRPPLMVLSDHDQGPRVSVATFIVQSITILVVLVRLIAMVCLKRRPALEDVAIWIATSLGLVQSILVQVSIDHGLGRHVESLTNRSFELYNKYHYASELLLIVVLALAKLSIGLLIHKLTPKKELKLANGIVLGVIGFWTIFSIFSLAFQCHGPYHYIYIPSKCAGQGALYYLIDVLNIITDLGLAIIPIYVLWNVQLPLSTRLLVMGAFVSRLFVPTAAITQLAFMTKYLHSHDPTWTVSNPTICTQVMASISIVTACMPALHHVLTNLSTGLAGAHIPSALEGSTSGKYGYGSRSHQQHGGSKGGSGLKYSTSRRNQSHNRGRQDKYGRDRGINQSTTITNVSVTSQHSIRGGRRHDRRNGASPSSMDSTKRLTVKDGMVVKTTDFTIDIEEDSGEHESSSPKYA